MKRTGLHADGGGLYVRVTRSGSKSWIFRYALSGRKHDVGLGPYPGVQLREAREVASNLRQLLARNIDPLEQRRTETVARRQDAARAITFTEYARQFIEANEPGWKNPVHRRQWRSTIALYCDPQIGHLHLSEIDTDKILSILRPIWHRVPETATRVRGRLEVILDAAQVQGLREGENPARWRGHLSKVLPAKTRVHTVRHHAAMPFSEVPKLMSSLARETCISSRALQFLILNAARTSEVLLARWTEVDTRQRVWSLPAERMKAGREHRVPLSEAALLLLEDMRGLRSSSYIFPGARADCPLSNMSLAALMRRLGQPDYTVHGFRSSFRDWVAECTNFSGELAELALAHSISNAVEKAYRRGVMLEKRRILMDAWASFLSPRRTRHARAQRA